MKGGELYPCQVRKEPNGNLEYLKPKNEESDININFNIGFIKKPCIKPFNKDEIKVNENYKLCENMEENEFINFSFNDNDFNLNIEIIDIDDLYDFEDNNLNISSNFSINNDISTDYSYNTSLIHSDSDNQQD